jgi:hypothetical protein
VSISLPSNIHGLTSAVLLWIYRTLIAEQKIQRWDENCR